MIETPDAVETIGGMLNRTTSKQSNKDRNPMFQCPITGYPCEGDLSHLCEDYGCARKGGLSPNSDENR
jgi:hypothetical protein